MPKLNEKEVLMTEEEAKFSCEGSSQEGGKITSSEREPKCRTLIFTYLGEA